MHEFSLCTSGAGEGHPRAGCRDGCGCWAVSIRGVVSFDEKVSLQSKSYKIREMLCLSAAEECRFYVLSETLTFIIPPKMSLWGEKDGDSFSVFS